MASWWDTIGPPDVGAVGVGGRNKQAAGSGKGITKDIREVVKCVCVRQGVGKDGLGRSIVDAILNSSDLEGDASANWVVSELFRVCVSGGDCLLGANGSTNGPEVGVVITVILDNGVSNSSSEWGNGRDGSESNGFELHFEGYLVKAWGEILRLLECEKWELMMEITD